MQVGRNLGDPSSDVLDRAWDAAWGRLEKFDYRAEIVGRGSDEVERSVSPLSAVLLKRLEIKIRGRAYLHHTNFYLWFWFWFWFCGRPFFYVLVFVLS